MLLSAGHGALTAITKNHMQHSQIPAVTHNFFKYSGKTIFDSERHSVRGEHQEYLFCFIRSNPRRSGRVAIAFFR